MSSVQVASEDVLKALKRFKRLAKQDILASENTPDPTFWRTQAEFRRQVYDRLMKQVQTEGVARAYEEAVKAYAELPLRREDGAAALAAEQSGQRQALELFFHILGKPLPGQVDEGQGEGKRATRGGRGIDAGTPNGDGQALWPSAPLTSNA